MVWFLTSLVLVHFVKFKHRYFLFSDAFVNNSMLLNVHLFIAGTVNLLTIQFIFMYQLCIL